MSAAGIIAASMNVPYGPIVAPEDVVRSLRAGKLSAATSQANAILGAMFAEVRPELIIRCAIEEGLSSEHAQMLYEDTWHQGFPRCPQWEPSAKERP